jgi:hypothetical protein
MKRITISLLTLLLSCIFVLAVSAQGKEPGIYKVCLYNKTTKEIKAGCTEIIGRFSSKPIYKCYDSTKKRPAPFDLGTHWEAFPSSPVCMINPVTSVVIPDCIRCELSKYGDGQYFYLNKKSGKTHELNKPWESLSPDDPMCKSMKLPSGGNDPIKDFAFEIGSDSKDTEKEEQEP